nr:hypothetical protein [Tanacetum cinerariifolium]
IDWSMTLPFLDLLESPTPLLAKPVHWLELELEDKRLRDLMMMILVRQTEECDMMLYMMKTDMLMLVAEIKVGDKTVDDVDKLVCSADVVKSRQVAKNVAPASI